MGSSNLFLKKGDTLWNDDEGTGYNSQLLIIGKGTSKLIYSGMVAILK